MKLVLCEPSKVRNQHITLLDGLLQAHATFASAPATFLAHESLYAQLTPAARNAARLQPAAVMDPERRRLVRKSVLEAWVVARAIAALGKDEVLLITCVLPSALILIEAWKRLFPRKRVVVMLHGEMEGAFDRRRQGPGSFGFYVLRWLATRSRGSTLELAVIDDFIKGELLQRFPGKFDPDRMHVVPLPLMTPHAAGPLPSAKFRACFIGFDTPDKGFEHFAALTEAVPDVELVAIGGGRVRDLQSGTTSALANLADYLDAIARCDVGIFPYTGGYSCSLSAAVMDALSGALHVLATERGCFVGLLEALGPGVVTLERDPAAFGKYLSDPAWREAIRHRRDERQHRIAASHYNEAGVAAALQRLLRPQEASVPTCDLKVAA
jgi:glycosyltransferase involved in cell wall biosynthesis